MNEDVRPEDLQPREQVGQNKAWLHIKAHAIEAWYGLLNLPLRVWGWLKRNQFTGDHLSQFTGVLSVIGLFALPTFSITALGLKFQAARLTLGGLTLSKTLLGIGVHFSGWALGRQLAHQLKFQVSSWRRALFTQALMYSGFTLFVAMPLTQLFKHFAMGHGKFAFGAGQSVVLRNWQAGALFTAVGHTASVATINAADELSDGVNFIYDHLGKKSADTTSSDITAKNRMAV